MVRGALVVMAVVLVATLADAQVAAYSDWSSRRHQDHYGLPSEVASSIAQQIARSELGSVPIPYTKQFYVTFGPYYVENPLSIYDKPSVRLGGAGKSTRRG